LLRFFVNIFDQTRYLRSIFSYREYNTQPSIVDTNDESTARY
jgi:hypothetical protein